MLLTIIDRNVSLFGRHPSFSCANPFSKLFTIKMIQLIHQLAIVDLMV